MERLGRRPGLVHTSKPYWNGVRLPSSNLPRRIIENCETML
ncbi:protein of unknown function [Methylorubrum extorquens]|uniref:Uncharacterized protein n=1 Tax=Methylorubrum extorquens TaxID=408 RepID=A0A2N9AXT7_METEX|nr:protein of unknown function [Methylorubrum extorquens]